MDAGLTAAPPPLPPLLPPLSPILLDYGRRPKRFAAAGRKDGVMVVAALLSGLIAVALFGGMIELLIVTWPDFGATLLAVPIMLGVLAFGTVCVTSFRVVAGTTAGRPLVPSPVYRRERVRVRAGDE